MSKIKSLKGFSLVELVVVVIIISILSVATFTGGAAAIKKSQVTRVMSDLRNFAMATETVLNETPSIDNIGMNGLSDHEIILTALNKNLSEDYQLVAQDDISSSSDNNLSVRNGVGDNTWKVYRSAKKDPWDNPYFVILDYGLRHSKKVSDYFITVVSAGPNAKSTIGSRVESDDIFLLTQYTNGKVASATYDMTECTTGNVVVKNVYRATNVQDDIDALGLVSTGLYALIESKADYGSSSNNSNFLLTVTKGGKNGNFWYSNSYTYYKIVSGTARKRVPVVF